MTINFDDYKDSYRDDVQGAVSFIGQEAEFFTQAKVRHLLDLIRRKLGDPKDQRILDVGCGVGSTDRLLVDQVGSLVGVDVSDGSVAIAQQAIPQAEYHAYDGAVLPFPDDQFDLSFAICVVHHVPPAQWEAFCAEMARVTRPGGVVAIFEHNPYNPLTRLVVARCEFDADAVLLHQSKTRKLLQGAGLSPVEQAYILFFPFHNAGTAWVESRLRRVPLGAQYYVVGQKAVSV